MHAKSSPFRAASERDGLRSALPVVVAMTFLLAPALGQAQRMPSGLEHKIKFANAAALLALPKVELIVEVSRVPMPAAAPGAGHSRAQLDALRARLEATKSRSLGRAPSHRVLHDYAHLPYVHISVSTAELPALLSDADVVAVHENALHTADLASSLPATQQPAVLANTPLSGAGFTVAVVDTGVDFTQPEFGTCTAAANGWQPVSSANCRVVRSLDFGDGDGVADDVGHGTNVAAIAASIAPGADIIMLDAFNGPSASTANILSALDWVLDNQATYNIVSVNLSLGSIQDLDGDNTAWQIGDVDGDGTGDVGYTSANCPTSYSAAFVDLLNAGVVSVATSGNAGLVGTVGSPGCDPTAITVGATFDENVPDDTRQVLNVNLGVNKGFDLGLCTSTNPQNESVTCFSNSSGQVELVAPGMSVTAGGFTMTGTSMAAPHVAGAVALSAEAGGGALTGNELRQDMLATTSTAADPKAGAGVTRPRLDVVDSVLASSPWTSITLALSPASWYVAVPESLVLSVVGLGHDLYGANTSAGNSRVPLENRLRAPLIVSSLQ
jgi:subtilisin family serine protease